MTYTRDLEKALKAALGEIQCMQKLVDWYKQKNIEWQDKYDIEKEQLEQERDYLDGRCAALENDLVLDDVVSKLEKVQIRLADFETKKEQVCEWVEPTNNPYGDLYIPLCNEDKIFEIESINEYHYCPNCGRRIVYKESEEE